MSSVLPYTIREARPNDAEGIAFVHTMSWKEAYKGIIDATFLDTLTLKDRLALRHKIFKEWKGVHYVALVENEIVGFCDAGDLRFHQNQLLAPKQKEARTEKGEIYAFYLLSDSQRQGIGRALFQTVRSHINNKGLSPFLAWTFKDNPKARRFYETQGGTLVDEVGVKIGDKVYQEVAYRFEGILKKT